MGIKKSDNDKNLAKKSFGSYLHMNRECWRISQKKLARGLCSYSMIDEIEKGEKSAKWLLTERILRRVQVESGRYECHLTIKDYMEWKSEEEIIAALEQSDARQMTILLKEYAENNKLEEDMWEEGKKEDVSKRLQRQFYLAMYGMCRKLQNAPKEELLEIFSRALQLTVPGYEEDLLCDLAPCAEEINLMLEYVQCLPINEGIRRCLQIKRYLEDARMEDITRVLNYPKTILVLCRMQQQQEVEEEWKYNEILKISELAFELMRKTKRIYYLGELMEIVREAEKQINILRRENIKNSNSTREITEKIWECFSELSIRMGVWTEQTDAYLYRRQDVYYVGDCIRMRRKQKGITQRELCEGICNIETLQALENGKGKKGRNTHPTYIQELCERLGLSPEMIRTELVTSGLEARRLEREICDTANKGNFLLNLQQLEELKSLIDMSEPINQQWVLRTEGLAKYELGKIDKEKYEEMVKRAWECTLPLAMLEHLGEQEYYLTNSEMECIYYLSRPYAQQEPTKAEEIMRGVFELEKGFEETGQERVHIRTYELYIGYKAGILHEQGEYEQGKQCAEKVIKLCLQMKRVNILDLALYSWMRSNVKIQNKKTELKEASYNWKKDLENCLALSQFCENSKNEKTLKAILENIN